MINQYQPLDSGPFRDTLFSDQSKSKGHTIFPKTATSWPHKPTNLVFQVLSVDHLVLKKKEFPNKSPLGLLEHTHHILWSSNIGEKPQLQASDDWKFSHLPVELDPPHRAVSDFTTNFGRWTCKISRYATVCRNLEWTCSSCPSVSHLFAHDVLLATKAT
jgi:hypothetical protein